MVASFPPCKAKYRDARTCQQIEANPQFNMSGIAWVNGHFAILVVAEVPCSSLYGGIMCQVKGYKVNAENGQILEQMTASQLSSRWQKSMAWHFRVPEPPEYERSFVQSAKP